MQVSAPGEKSVPVVPGMVQGGPEEPLYGGKESVAFEVCILVCPSSADIQSGERIQKWLSSTPIFNQQEKKGHW
jgi:hypothetical protein